MYALNDNKIRIFPSLIAADLLNLEKEIRALDPYVSGYHIDIMDGHFVPNVTWGAMFVDAISKVTKKPLWIHLMVDNPGWWVHSLNLPEASIVSIHIESTKNVEECLKIIKEKKWITSLAVSPKTPISETFQFFGIIDHLLVMSVDPGFSGQRFIPEVQEKIKTAVERLHEIQQHCVRQHSIILACDGGINAENIKSLIKNGVTDFAIASSIFLCKDRVKATEKLNDMIYNRDK